MAARAFERCMHRRAELHPIHLVMTCETDIIRGLLGRGVEDAEEHDSNEKERDPDSATHSEYLAAKVEPRCRIALCGESPLMCDSSHRDECAPRAAVNVRIAYAASTNAVIAYAAQTKLQPPLTSPFISVLPHSERRRARGIW